MQFEFSVLLRSVRDGDESALNDLFDRYYAVVQRLVHKGLATEMRPGRPWLGALFSTGDVVQEVFMSVLRDLENFEGGSEPQFVKFLATVTKSRLVDSIRFHEAMRRDRRRVRPVADEVRAKRGSPVRDAVTAEEVALFCSALSRFPERERLLLRGRLERGAQYAVLADELGYPSPDAARKAFHSAQARLAMNLSALQDDVE